MLADRDIVAPKSSLLYFVLALAPFALWIGVAILRRTSRPFLDFLTVGVLYGLSLKAVRQILSNAGSGQGTSRGTVDFAARFEADQRNLPLGIYSTAVSLGIGVGTGLVAALVAFARRMRDRRRHGQSSDLDRVEEDEPT